MLPPGRTPGTVQRFPVLAEEIRPLPLRQRAQDASRVELVILTRRTVNWQGAHPIVLAPGHTPPRLVRPPAPGQFLRSQMRRSAGATGCRPEGAGGHPAPRAVRHVPRGGKRPLTARIHL